MMKKILLEIVLEEGKRENIAYCIKNGLNPECAKYIAEKFDPTPTKKYTFTILKWLNSYADALITQNRANTSKYKISYNKNDDIVLDFFSVILTSSTAGDAPFVFLYRFYPNYDIQQIKSVSDFVEKINDMVRTTPLSKKQQIKIGKDESARKKVFENDKCTVYQILKREAACVYGKGTKWCITQLHMRHFENYNHDSTIYFLIDKKNNDNKLAILSLKSAIKPSESTSKILYGKSSELPKVNLDVYNPEDQLVYCSDINSLQEWNEELVENLTSEFMRDYDIKLGYDESFWDHIDVNEFEKEFVGILLREKKLIDINAVLSGYGIPGEQNFFTYISKPGETNEPYGV